MPLTDIEIRKAKHGPKTIKLSDGGGLQLWLEPDGGKRWRLAYRFGGKQKGVALGVYPTLGLKGAREARDSARRLLAEGRDPSEAKKSDRLARAVSSAETFGAVAAELAEKKRREGRAEATVTKFEWLMSLANPYLGHKPIAEIKAAEALAALRTVESRGRHETAKKLRAAIGEVFRYAIATARAENDPSAALRGALTAPTVVHRPAITEPVGFGALLRAVDGYTGAPETKAALELLALTFVRPGELRAAEWGEFDLEAGVWTIPKVRMKMRGGDHQVPLAPRAVAILRELKAIYTGGNFIFSALRSRNRPMSENTLNAALRNLGYSKEEMVAHGFRATASSMLNKCRQFHPDAIERQLAHAEKDRMRGIYNREEHWDERVKMMSYWADRCDAMRRGGDVNPFKSGGKESA
jgi:integrase